MSFNVLFPGQEREIHVKTNFTYIIDQPGFLRNQIDSKIAREIEIVSKIDGDNEIDSKIDGNNKIDSKIDEDNEIDSKFDGENELRNEESALIVFLCLSSSSKQR